jgi:hypothetical protein
VPAKTATHPGPIAVGLGEIRKWAIFLDPKMDNFRTNPTKFTCFSEMWLQKRLLTCPVQL